MEGEQHRTKTQLEGYSSFVAKKPVEEFQIDLFFMPGDDQKI